MLLDSVPANLNGLSAKERIARIKAEAKALREYAKTLRAIRKGMK